MLCLTITEFYSQFLQTTLDSYRQGCAKFSEITPENAQYLAEQKLQTLIMSRLEKLTTKVFSPTKRSKESLTQIKC
jgi:hypothetical protein